MTPSMRCFFNAAALARTCVSSRSGAIFTNSGTWRARLALQAYRLAGDPHAFPEQLGEEGLAPFAPARVLLTDPLS